MAASAAVAANVPAASVALTAAAKLVELAGEEPRFGHQRLEHAAARERRVGEPSTQGRTARLEATGDCFNSGISVAEAHG